jgi:hypothetical protein
MVSLLSECEEKYGIKITFSVESEPLDTGAKQLGSSLHLRQHVL